jgi:3-hydroxyisobutyrate dehydrogenase-like beta-hydroxyacid dehydrogenase
MTGSLDQAVDTNGVGSGACDVVVLGCGNMGAAFARSLLASGRRVAVWNRTTERARALVEAGAELRTSAEDAVLLAPLVIVCLSSTDDVRAVLDGIEEGRLAGRTVLNVTTGTPEDAHALRDWAHERGVGYLDAAIGAYPEQIGTSEARILVAGNEQLWTAHEATVRALAGSSIHVGADHRAANVVDASMTGAFYISSLVSFVEAMRFMRAFGVSYDVVADLVGYSVAVMEDQLQQIVQRIRDASFATSEATLAVYAAASEAFAEGMGAQGDASMIRTTARVLRQAVDAGLGDADIAAVFTLTRAS